MAREEINAIINALQTVEQRYAFENALMEAVTRGQLEKASTLAKTFAQMRFPSPTEDLLRKLKNYATIANTLLRKAAQKGGVQPAALDEISSGFSKDIEQIDSENAAKALMEQMTLAYCRLVRTNTATTYSPPVQKAIACIDADLTAHLSLGTLAKALNISSSYLSTLFKKETGQTITGYIHARRIRHAMHLLQTTNLQVQSIAQQCGMEDVHYFSKIFKRFAGLSPREYRASSKGHKDETASQC